MSTKLHHGLWIITGLLVVCCAAGCAKKAADMQAVGVLSSDPGGQENPDANPVALEQQAGYELSLQEGAGGYRLVQTAEGNRQGDVQTAIRSMVEEESVVAVVGATTNEATVRAATLVNFFNVPMLVPTTGGENLLPSNNLWVFRLSPPSSEYAGYIFGSVLQQLASVSDKGDEETTAENTGLKLAIVYEQDTFGESAAVETARAAMKLSMEIALYEAFPSSGFEPEQLAALAKDVKTSGAHLVYLICDDPVDSKILVAALREAFGAGVAPVLIGQEGGFASQSFLSTAEASGVYVVRQAIDSTECPAEVDSIYEAQTYASMYLLQEAIRQAEESQPAKTWLSSLLKTKADPITTRRERLRDTLKQINVTAPCIGSVSFDNSGANKQLNFELLLVEDGKPVVVSADHFRASVEKVFSGGAQDTTE